MRIEKLSEDIDVKKLITKLGVDGGGISILASKVRQHLFFIKDLHVGAANILKQDALSIGADLAVPRGTVLAKEPSVDCLLIATHQQLKILSKKELAQPFGLKELALELGKTLKVKKPESTKIMGVINANEDSFFKGSRFQDKNAIKRIEKMIEEGASIIDIGGVSSRPHAKIVDVDDELERVKPILKALYDSKLYERVSLSIDSYEPKVIDYALKSGFSIVNDITGLANDEVSKLCASYDATAVIMHMQGTPQTMQNNPQYDSLLSDVYAFFEQRVQNAESLGVKDIVLDVGIGFGKSLNDNLKLIKHLGHFSSLGKALLVGASRKSMIDLVSESRVEDRLSGTLALHLESVKNGASILRVHDVYEHIQALALQKALFSLES